MDFVEFSGVFAKKSQEMDEPDLKDQTPVTQASHKVAIFCISVKWLHFCHVS